MPELTDRIDSFGGDDPPPKRRFRLVLDVGADTLEELSSALTSIDLDIRHPDGPVTWSQTRGGAASGWHWELADAGDEMTHGEYMAALTRWRARQRNIPTGGSRG